MTSVRRTHRWNSVLAIALLASAVGVYANRPFVLLSAIVGVAFVAYSHITEPPDVNLCLQRSVSDDTPQHNKRVTVTVTVENIGSHILPDVRISDGVPELLTVVDGTAHHAAALQPGSSTQFSYTVTAKHGGHSFQPARVIARDLSGAIEVETTVSEAKTPSWQARIDCPADVDTAPLHRRTTQSVGRVQSNKQGSGVEFDRVREYQYGDSSGRIDWKRFARTKQLTTVDFREERIRTVMLCLDARREAYCASGPDEPHGVSYSVAAAKGLLTELLSQRARVGIAVVGRTFCWFAPGTGDSHQAKAQEILMTHPSVSVEPPDEQEQLTDEQTEQQLRTLEARVEPTTQLVLLSPLTDSFITKSARRLEAQGHAPTVISPDMTTDGTLGERFGRIERANRIHLLREAGIPIIDWNPDGPIETTLQRPPKAGMQ